MHYSHSSHASQYVVLLVCTLLGYVWINGGFQANGSSKHVEEEEEEEEEPEPPRNFTTKQLRFFDGNMNEKTEEMKPVYLSVGGTVFDGDTVVNGAGVPTAGPWDNFEF